MMSLEQQQQYKMTNYKQQPPMPQSQMMRLHLQAKLVSLTGRSPTALSAAPFNR